VAERNISEYLTEEQRKTKCVTFYLGKKICENRNIF